MNTIEQVGNAAEKLGDAFDKNLTSTEEKMALYNKGQADAREMHIKELEQDDPFSKRAIYYLAFFWSFVAAAYIFMVSFFEIPEANQRIVDTVIGFLLGTIIAAIINFFFGSSYSSATKTKQSDGLIKRLFTNK